MTTYTVSHPTYNGDSVLDRVFSTEQDARDYIKTVTYTTRFVLRKSEVLSI